MMTLIWTTLPAGIRYDNVRKEWMARVSVFLTPRLEVADDVLPLSAFPAFSDWPKTLRTSGPDGITFSIQVSDGTQTVAQLSVAPLAANPNDLPSSKAWRGIFNEGIVVRTIDPPSAERAASTVESYDAGGLLNAVRKVYTNALAPPAKRMSNAEALTDFVVPSGNAAGPLAVNDNAVTEFMHFHRRAATIARRTKANEVEPCPDFHQIVASISAHPMLLRKLGLVLDIELPAAQLRLDAGDAPLRIRATPTLPGRDDATHISYWTAIELDTAGTDQYRVFCAASESNKSNGGFYALNNGKTAIAQENLEQATLALVQTATSKEPQPLPALLQGGMRLLDSQVPANLRDAIKDQSELEQRLENKTSALRSGLLADAADEDPDDQPLFAEQLTRGFRIDVRDTDDTQWRSLCERASRYHADAWSWPAARDQTIRDEGIVEPVTFVDDHASERSLRTTNDLFEWDGWSLAVPRPGGNEKLQESCAREDGPPLRIESEVPAGSLTPQRFGRCYQFRARSVDIAGNSLSLGEANAITSSLSAQQIATQPMCYLRVESAKPPNVFRAQKRGPGEAGDIIVVRDAEDPKYRTKQFRLHVFPPEVPLRIAEKHGVFDTMTASDAWQIIKNHRSELGRDADNEAREAIESEEAYTPYLPDPMVTSAVLKLPYNRGSIDLPSFEVPTHRDRERELARSCLLVIKAGKNDLKTQVSERAVTLTVPRGQEMTVQIAAKLSPEQLENSALVHTDWRNDSNGLQADLGAVAAAAANGDAPLLAPSRPVQIVHATQRPLIRPVFENPTLSPRLADTTTAVLTDDALLFDAPSTGRIDVYANWQDPVDDPTADRWYTTDNDMHAGGERIKPDALRPFGQSTDELRAKPPLAHDFGDTKHHEVRYQAVAASRFVEFYPRELTDDPANTTRASTPVTLHVPSTAPPAAPDVAYVLPTFMRNDAKPAGNDYAAEQIGNGLRLYMHRGWFSSGKGEQLALVVATGDAQTAPDDLVSAWGANPLRDSAPLPGPLKMQHIISGVARIDTWPSLSDNVGLVIHDVQFSEEHKLPFVDIEFDAQAAFMPLVRLVLARYQAHAIADCLLSKTVQADFVPLAPGRTVTLKKTAKNRWNINARGFSYRQTLTASSQTSVVQAQVEYLSINVPDDPAAWQPLGDAVTLEPNEVSAYQYQWVGQIQIEDQRYLSDRWRLRLTIQEYEPFDHPDLPGAELADYSRLLSAHTIRL